MTVLHEFAGRAHDNAASRAVSAGVGTAGSETDAQDILF